LSKHPRIIALLAAAGLLLALVVGLSFRAFSQVESAAEARHNTDDLIARADAVLSQILGAETGHRGFLMTGNASFLAPYLAAREVVVDDLQTLVARTRSAASQKHLANLQSLLNDKLALMAGLIEARRRGSATVALAAGIGEGQRQMDAIRIEVRQFVAIESDMLKQNDAALKADMRTLFRVIVAASLLALLLALSFAYLVSRELRHRSADADHLRTRLQLDGTEDSNALLTEVNGRLLVSEELLAVTLNSIGDAVIATDAAGRVTRLNTTAARLTGWSLEQALGRPVGEIFDIISQETRQPAAVPVMETLAKGTIQGLANHTVLISRDKSECPIADSCAPIRDRDGRVVGAVLVFRDVTEEYAAQQALRDSAAQIRTVLNTIGEGVITIHASGGLIETVNPAAARIFGYGAAELIGQNFTLLIPELDKDSRSGSLEYYSAGAEERAAGLGREVMGRRKDGSTFPVEILASEMWLGDERYFTGVLRDVTVRKRVEAERNEAMALAEKANLAKSDFLSSMSHELRTPLNAILGFAQLLESGTPPPTPTQKRSIVQILQGGWYLLELINEILDLALIESGGVTVSHEPVSLREVMNECRAMIEPQAQKRGIDITFPDGDTAYFVNADRTRIKQVLINLMFNAIKYNRPDGSVVIECMQSAAETIRLSVRDTGIGLTPAQLGQLFQPFNRIGKEAGAEEGTGIGLVVTKRLVELMGGRIGVESTVGTGSVFWIELLLTGAPRLSKTDINSVAVVHPPPEAGAVPRTLLYVEDNPANLELVEQLIARRQDLRLLSAADGDQGIEFARAYLPEVILMDINLPGISGIDAMRILRADAATAHIPIIALSANAVPRDIAAAMNAGFFSYLTKPIKVGEFMDTLDVAIKSAKKAADRKAPDPTSAVPEAAKDTI